MPQSPAFRACLIMLACLALPAQARDRDYLPPEVARAMAAHRLPGTSVSVYVREIGRDDALLSYNSAVARNPASTMKVVTIRAGIELFGPAYTW